MRLIFATARKTRRVWYGSNRVALRPIKRTRRRTTREYLWCELRRGQVPRNCRTSRIGRTTRICLSRTQRPRRVKKSPARKRTEAGRVGSRSRAVSKKGGALRAPPACHSDRPSGRGRSLSPPAEGPLHSGAPIQFARAFVRLGPVKPLC